jgi:hypothetical protein
VTGLQYVTELSSPGAHADEIQHLHSPMPEPEVKLELELDVEIEAGL